MYTPPKLERFNENVLSKYQIYNSVFLTLPFDTINNTGVLLPLFSEVCEKGFQDGHSPLEIVEAFSEKYLDGADERQRINILFRFIQYVERQIVLFDAIEDAAFDVVHNMEGHGSLRDIKDTAEANGSLEKLRDFLQNYKVRTVLTAHPTQFYPGSVLGIIHDLAASVKKDDLSSIRELLAQLGKTPFIKDEKPTPYDEAVSLTWYLENVFYQTAGEMLGYIRQNIFQGENLPNEVLNFGFWPGGDRDGNPFVTTQISLDVAERLRSTIFKCYYRDVRKLKRRLTFEGVESLVSNLEHKIYRSAFYAEYESLTVADFQQALSEIRERLIAEHQSLYLQEVDDLANKLQLFGFYFAALDIRQNSKIHDAALAELQQSNLSVLPENYMQLPESERFHLAMHTRKSIDCGALPNGDLKDTLESVQAMRTIQQRNGARASNRYVISNCSTALHVAETFLLVRLCGWEQPDADIVPLFEAIEDLSQAHLFMAQLYQNSEYRSHLERRGKRQTVMLGFSDGTKDGGYLMANWSIYRAKEAISAVSREYGIEVLFFDGRGGPPARGGGKTHKFYASLGPEIENHELQLTIQGQTISSNFGTPDSCRFNLENLLSAGVSGNLYDNAKNRLAQEEKAVIDELAQLGYETYSAFKKHPKFIPYLERMSTLNYYAKTNIGSRPSKRSKGDGLVFEDLRAIPFVGSWSQLKQNVPGFFGVGSALEAFDKSGRWNQVQQLYNHSLFFRTLLENSMMSLAKSFFPLTAYMKDDPEFGKFWQIIFDEFQRSKKYLLRIAGHEKLMENYPDGKASIEVREKIVIPLLVVQQYALQRIKQIEKGQGVDPELQSVYEKMVTRSLFGNTNAARNSA